jgi:hypothetical protein
MATQRLPIAIQQQFSSWYDTAPIQRGDPATTEPQHFPACLAIGVHITVAYSIMT